jgi:NTE family protein
MVSETAGTGRTEAAAERGAAGARGARSGGGSGGARRALVLGCGGTLGAAWSIAVLDAIAHALGWDPRSADVLVGTSAGAGLAAMLGAGVGVERLLEASLGGPGADAALARHFASPPGALPPLPRPRLGSPRLLWARGARALTSLAGLLPVGRGDAAFLDDVARACVSAGGRWVVHPATWLVAVDFDDGGRVAFGRAGAPRASLPEALRASWAVPGWFPPVPVAGRRYVDGGVASPASADLLADTDVDEVIVVAPMASTTQGPRRGLGRIEGALRGHMRRTLDREVALLRARGKRVVRVEPGPEDLAVLGPNFMDGARRLRVLESSLRTAPRAVRAALERGGDAHPVEARSHAKSVSEEAAR